MKTNELIEFLESDVMDWDGWEIEEFRMFEEIIKRLDKLKGLEVDYEKLMSIVIHHTHTGRLRLSPDEVGIISRMTNV